MKTKTELAPVVKPIGSRILVRKDENRKATKGGIALPDSTEIPVWTARILEIAEKVENDDDYPIHQYDRVLVHPGRAIPVDFENEHLYVIPVEDVVAVLRKNKDENDKDEYIKEADKVIAELKKQK